MDIYEEMGLRRVINARGRRPTILGGSILPKEVLDAMSRSNEFFVDMSELIDQTGKTIAQMLGSGGALVTAGGSSALLLAAAACMAGKDDERASRLPSSDGMRNEFIVQRGSKNPYTRSITSAGGRIREVGGDEETTASQIEDSIVENTAGIYFRKAKNALPIGEVVAVGKRHGVPVLVDAAGETYPVDTMKAYLRVGADLIAQGAKYFDGPGSAGILYGREDLVEAAKFHSFTTFEHVNYPEYYPPSKSLPLGRGMKLDRQSIVGTVVALRRWMELDHKARFEKWHKTAEAMASALAALPNVEAKVVTVPSEERDGIPTFVLLRIAGEHSGITATGIQKSLQAGNPSIWLVAHGDELRISAETLVEGDEDILVERLGLLLS